MKVGIASKESEQNKISFLFRKCNLMRDEKKTLQKFYNSTYGKDKSSSSVPADINVRKDQKEKVSKTQGALNGWAPLNNDNGNLYYNFNSNQKKSIKKNRRRKVTTDYL